MKGSDACGSSFIKPPLAASIAISLLQQVNSTREEKSTPTSTPPPQEPTGLYVLGSTGAVNIAIAAGSAILLLKKR